MILYHGTHVRNLPDILKRGIRPHREIPDELSIPKAVYLSSDPSDARDFGLAVLMVDVPSDWVEHNVGAWIDEEYMVRRTIPSDMIVKVVSER